MNLRGLIFLWPLLTSGLFEEEEPDLYPSLRALKWLTFKTSVYGQAHENKEPCPISEPLLVGLITQVCSSNDFIAVVFIPSTFNGLLLTLVTVHQVASWASLPIRDRVYGWHCKKEKLLRCVLKEEQSCQLNGAFGRGWGGG